MRAIAAALALSAWASAGAEPLTLDAAIAAARGGHPDVLQARATLLAARAQKGIAIAAYLPTVDLSGYGRGDLANFTPVVVGTAASPTTTFPFQRSGQYYASLGINQLLFDGGRTLGQIAVARAQLAQSAASLDNRMLAVEGAVIAAYFNVLQARAEVAIDLDYEQQTEAQVKSVRRLIGAGIRPELDALAAETRHQRAMLDRIRDENAYEQNRVTLLSALGLEGGHEYELEEAFVAEIPEERVALDDLMRRASERRPDLRALGAELKAVELNVRVQRSDYLPALSLGLAGDLTGSSATPAPVYDLYGTLTLTEHLFSGLSTYRGMQVARAQLEAERAKVASTRVQIRAALAGAQAGVRNGREAASQALQLVAQAERQLASAQKRYDAGLATLLELFDAQTQRVQARTQEVQARYALAISRADLARAVGGSLLAEDKGRAQ